MERKIKHRILGILVVIGLVIILLPLLQSGSENPAEATMVQAPPFPDQSAQTPAEPEQTQTPATQDQDMSAPQPLPLQNPSQDSGMSQQPDDTVDSNSPAQSTTPMPNQENATPAPISSQPETKANPETPLPTDMNANPAAPNTSSNDTNTQSNISSQPNVSLDMPKQISELTKVTENAAEPNQVTQQEIAQPEAQAKIVKSPKHAAKKTTQKFASAKRRAIPSNQPIDDDGLLKLKNSVWVIQMGSFTNKANAVRLVNKLRGNGYAAFIQQVASSTRVFVGPESKQHAARTLASQINSEMHLQGIVISYKPLAI